MSEPSLDTLLADARDLAKRAPTHTARQYEDAMCDLARREAAPGESEGAALSRLLADRDDRLVALSKAAHAAGIAERAPATARTQELAMGLMRKRAEQCASPGESVDDAFARLGREGDEIFSEAYRIYCGG
jgi:hypothetical protein